MATSDRAEYCPRCGTAFKQPKHGGRPRKFCTKARCRQAESRAQKLAEIQQREQEQKEVLEKTWLQFDSETRDYLRTIADDWGLAGASGVTGMFLHLLSQEKQEKPKSRKDNASPPARHDLSGASTADLMQETAARLEALSAETAKERDVFVNRQGLVLGRLYASLVPYLAEDTNTREKSLTLSRTYHKR